MVVASEADYEKYVDLVIEQGLLVKKGATLADRGSTTPTSTRPAAAMRSRGAAKDAPPNAPSRDSMRWIGC